MNAPRYVARRRATIEAVEWTGTNFDEMRSFVGEHHIYRWQPKDNVAGPAVFVVDTMYGRHELRPGEFVYKGAGGRVSYLSAEAFEAMYEPVPEGVA